MSRRRLIDDADTDLLSAPPPRWKRLMRISPFLLIGFLATGGCALAMPWDPHEDQATEPTVLAAAPTMQAPDTAGLFRVPGPEVVALAQSRRNWTCVSYVQEFGTVDLRGDGWQWWDRAKGNYERGNTPRIGSILVLKRTQHMRHGHVAIVSDIVDSRTIRVDHANWGWNRATRGQIHLGMIVKDVSRNNDWSQTRFWYEPGDTLGSRTYPTAGFIYAPQPSAISGTVLRAADAG